MKFPGDLDPVIKDLIKKLLVIDEHKRLGAGKKGTKNDFTALKLHNFFTGVDFNNLHLK
jgi:hypothetical protein